MAARVQQQKTSRRTEPEVEEQAPPANPANTAEIDELLDEIDGVLEENAEQFVKDYTQKGGE